MWALLYTITKTFIINPLLTQEAVTSLFYQKQNLESCYLSARNKNVNRIWPLPVIIYRISTWKNMLPLSWKWTRKLLSCCFFPHRKMFDNIAYSHGEALRSISKSLGQLKFSQVLAQNVDHPAGRWTTQLGLPRNWGRIWTFVGQVYCNSTFCPSSNKCVKSGVNDLTC